VLSIIQAAGWPIWPLIICSIAALALVIERFVSLQTARVAPASLLEEALAVARQGPPTAEVVLQLEQNSQLGRVLAAGFRALAAQPRSTEAQLREALETEGKGVAMELERYLSTLGTIASAAPLLGLLGTVIGMIEIFGSQPAAASGSNPAQLAHGISVALYNTAFGLMVAIPSLMFWRHFRSRVDAYLAGMEIAGDRFVRHVAQLQHHR
jgi:biopolymer transport protein ExbB